MTDLREALRKAAQQKPESGLAAQINQSATQARKDEAQDARFQAVGRKFNSLGNAAYQMSANSSHYRGETSMDVLRSQWRQAMAGFAFYPQARKEELLRAFAEGLRLTGETLDHRHQDFLQTARAFGIGQAGRLLDSPEQFKVSNFTGAIALYEGLQGLLGGQTVLYQAEVALRSGPTPSLGKAIEVTAGLLPINKA